MHLMEQMNLFDVIPENGNGFQQKLKLNFV